MATIVDPQNWHIRLERKVCHYKENRKKRSTYQGKPEGQNAVMLFAYFE